MSRLIQVRQQHPRKSGFAISLLTTTTPPPSHSLSIHTCDTNSTCITITATTASTYGTNTTSQTDQRQPHDYRHHIHSAVSKRNLIILQVIIITTFHLHPKSKSSWFEQSGAASQAQFAYNKKNSTADNNNNNVFI